MRRSSVFASIFGMLNLDSHHLCNFYVWFRFASTSICTFCASSTLAVRVSSSDSLFDVSIFNFFSFLLHFHTCTCTPGPFLVFGVFQFTLTIYLFSLYLLQLSVYLFSVDFQMQFT